MRTAIFVYQSTVVNIQTSESDLELSRMDSGSVSLLQGQNEQPLGPGVYKIVSSHDITVTGIDGSAFDVVVAPNNKDNPPTLPPRLAGSPSPIDPVALQAFFAVPESKSVANP